MRISDWSSDVCSSDLTAAPMFFNQIPAWFGDELATIALENGGDIIFGVPEQIPGEASGTLQFNSAVSIGNVPPQRYRNKLWWPLGKSSPFEPLFSWFPEVFKIRLPTF